ncbi:glutamate-gated chloride channel alpha-like [Penaeus vannamei]|uniref:glutamate-gated chloride channel alpha-like n=1 Tax=Penaeus vannamei TaxID=6689 RepID=UPI00387F9E9E
MNNTYAHMVDDESDSIPIGTSKWIFSHGFCGEQAGVAQSLTLSQCAKNKEFTCDDGTCIPINQVCDRREQCTDMSDELDCSTVFRPRGYQSTLPPPSGNMSSPLPVYLNLTLSSFGNVDAVNNRFTVELVVRMIWKDQRLLFKHLRRDRHLNIILPKEAETIWVPTIDFLNAENNQHTNVDQDCKITIKRLGNPLPDDIENFKEARIYKGSENYIRISRKYTITFRCHFNFFYFPFNTDFCNMEFRINKNTKNYVSLEKYGNAVHYVCARHTFFDLCSRGSETTINTQSSLPLLAKGRDQLTEYHVGGMYTERLTSEEPYSGLVTVIMMEHLYATQLVTIFVPTTLINLISFATFCFKWFDFQNRIIVSLTALLVLSTLFGQIAEHLPRTSYFKLIDIWFFFSILFSFVIIIIHTLVEYHHHYPSPNHTPGSPPLPRRANSAKEPPHPYKWAMLINRWGCLVTSGLYGIFFLAFWAIALSQKVSEKAKKIVDLENMTMMGYPN